MAKILIHESNDGKIFFDTVENWFYYENEEGNFGKIEMIRPGWFDLTPEEADAIKSWIVRCLQIGILQSRQTDL